MHQNHWKSFGLAAVVFVLASMVSPNLHAQERAGDQNDQRSSESRDAHPAARPEEQQHPIERSSKDGPRNDGARANNSGNDSVVRYRHAHPGAAARCHDGFFTKTSDRNRACTKHGGIDVWLVL